MKVLGISGTLRKGGNTEILVKEALTSAEGVGAETEFLSLIGKDIKFCDGCFRCIKTGTCHIKDDMQIIYRKLHEADGIILGSPVFAWSVAGVVKCLIDRMFAMGRPSHNPIMKMGGKVGGAIAVGERRGLMETLSYIERVFKNKHMLVTDNVPGFGLLRGDVRADVFAMKSALEMGIQMVKLIELKFAWPEEYSGSIYEVVARKYGVRTNPIFPNRNVW